MSSKTLFKFSIPIIKVYCFKKIFSNEKNKNSSIAFKSYHCNKNLNTLNPKPKLKFIDLIQNVLIPKVFCSSCFPLQCEDIHRIIHDSKKKIDQFMYTHETEEKLRAALKSAISLKDRKLVVKVQLVLAQFYLCKDDLEKSEIMYKFVVQNLKLMSVPPTDLTMVEVSIHLAYINGLNNNCAPAHFGFEWAIVTLRKLLDEDCKGTKVFCLVDEKCTTTESATKHIQQLLSSALEKYGKYLHRKGINPQALIATLEALDYAKLVNENNDLALMVLYNDIASMKSDLNLHEEAVDDAWKAIQIAQAHSKVSRADKAVFYSNLGCIYYAMKDFTNASQAFDRAWDEVSRSRDQRLKANINSLLARFKHDFKARRWWCFW